MNSITWEQFLNFQQYYEKMQRVAPDYRVGQAFLNYFPNFDKTLIEQNLSAEYKLYNEKNAGECWAMIRGFIK
jgi:pectate lyase